MDSPIKSYSVFSKIRKTVLEKIQPSKKELLIETAFAQNLVSILLPHLPLGVVPNITGSVAKRTFISGNNEVDLFLLFPKSTSKSDFEQILISLLNKALPGVGYQLSYAELPYLRFHYKNHRIDLVPAYAIEDASELLSAVDRSILHTKFIRRNLSSNQIPDVLLLKQFLKSNGLYGAEIKIQGFSGYLCELLIVHFGSFWKMATFFASLKSDLVIDIKKYYDKSQYSLLGSRFGFFVMIDPTDKNRNVSAAVSRENFNLLSKLCKKLILKPSTSMFLDAPASFEDLVSANASPVGVMITMPRPNIVSDVLWGQIRKLMGQLEVHLKDYEVNSIFSDDSRHLVRIFVGSKKLENGGKVLLRGPPSKMKTHVEKFRKSHVGSKFSIRDGFIYVSKTIPVLSISDSIHAFFDSYAKTSKSHLAFSSDLIVADLIQGKDSNSSKKTNEKNTKVKKLKKGSTSKK